MSSSFFSWMYCGLMCPVSGDNLWELTPFLHMGPRDIRLGGKSFYLMNRLLARCLVLTWTSSSMLQLSPQNNPKVQCNPNKNHLIFK